MLFHSVDISMWIPIKKNHVTLHDPGCILRTLSSLHPIRHIPLLLLSHTASSHLFHSQLLSKSIRSLAAFLGQSKPISASSFKHICHPVRRSEDVLAVHTQHSEQTGILTSSRADLSQPLIVNPAPLWAPTPTPKSQPTNLQLACLCTPWHGQLFWKIIFLTLTTNNMSKTFCLLHQN